MFTFIISFLIGAMCIVIGILNSKGNISMLHSYHTHRVSEENRIPFGKMVGIGTIIIGIAVMVCSIFSIIAICTENPLLNTIGMIILTIGLIIGIGISFYAMFKYNKGIF